MKDMSVSAEQFLEQSKGYFKALRILTDQMDKNILPAVGVGTFKYLDCLYR